MTNTSRIYGLYKKSGRKVDKYPIIRRLRTIQYSRFRIGRFRICRGHLVANPLSHGPLCREHEKNLQDYILFTTIGTTKEEMAFLRTVHYEPKCHKL